MVFLKSCLQQKINMTKTGSNIIKHSKRLIKQLTQVNRSENKYTRGAHQQKKDHISLKISGLEVSQFSQRDRE